VRWLEGRPLAESAGSLQRQRQRQLLCLHPQQPGSQQQQQQQQQLRPGALALALALALPLLLLPLPLPLLLVEEEATSGSCQQRGCRAWTSWAAQRTLMQLGTLRQCPCSTLLLQQALAVAGLGEEGAAAAGLGEGEEEEGQAQGQAQASSMHLLRSRGWQATPFRSPMCPSLQCLLAHCSGALAVALEALAVALA
jgi:hypothetical protein